MNLVAPPLPSPTSTASSNTTGAVTPTHSSSSAGSAYRGHIIPTNTSAAMALPLRPPPPPRGVNVGSPFPPHPPGGLLSTVPVATTPLVVPHTVVGATAATTGAPAPVPTVGVHPTTVATAAAAPSSPSAALTPPPPSTAAAPPPTPTGTAVTAPTMAITAPTMTRPVPGATNNNTLGSTLRELYSGLGTRVCYPFPPGVSEASRVASACPLPTSITTASTSCARPPPHTQTAAAAGSSLQTQATAPPVLPPYPLLWGRGLHTPFSGVTFPHPHHPPPPPPFYFPPSAIPFFYSSSPYNSSAPGTSSFFSANTASVYNPPTCTQIMGPAYSAGLSAPPPPSSSPSFVHCCNSTTSTTTTTTSHPFSATPSTDTTSAFYPSGNNTSTTCGSRNSTGAKFTTAAGPGAGACNTHAPAFVNKEGFVEHSTTAAHNRAFSSNDPPHVLSSAGEGGSSTSSLPPRPLPPQQQKQQGRKQPQQQTAGGGEMDIFAQLAYFTLLKPLCEQYSNTDTLTDNISNIGNSSSSSHQDEGVAITSSNTEEAPALLAPATAVTTETTATAPVETAAVIVTEASTPEVPATATGAATEEEDKEAAAGRGGAGEEEGKKQQRVAGGKDDDDEAVVLVVQKSENGSSIIKEVVAAGDVATTTFSRSVNDVCREEQEEEEKATSSTTSIKITDAIAEDTESRDNGATTTTTTSAATVATEATAAATTVAVAVVGSGSSSSSRNSNSEGISITPVTEVRKEEDSEEKKKRVKEEKDEEEKLRSSSSSGRSNRSGSSNICVSGSNDIYVRDSSSHLLLGTYSETRKEADVVSCVSISSANTERKKSRAEIIEEKIREAKSYDEVKKLVDMYASKADRMPGILAVLLLRLAVFGKDIFKEHLNEMLRSQKDTSSRAASAAVRKDRSYPPPGSALSSLPSILHQDPRFLGFLATCRELADRFLQRVRRVGSGGGGGSDGSSSASGAIDGQALHDCMWGLSLCRLSCLEQQRELGQHILKQTTLTPSQLSTVFCSYVRSLEAASDTMGRGISVEPCDARFIERLTEKLLHADNDGNFASLSAKQIVFLLHACSRLNCDHPVLLKRLGKAALAKEELFQPKERAAIVSAYTRFGIPLRGECEKIKRKHTPRDWQRPPPPKKPKPISQC